jgi:hypothetical protein
MSDFFGTQMNVESAMTTRQKVALTVLLVVAIAVVVVWWIRTSPKDIVYMGPTNVGPQVNLDPAKQWIPLMDADQIAKTSGNNMTCSFFLYLDPSSELRMPNNQLRSSYFLTVGNSLGIAVDPTRQLCTVDILQAKPNTHRGTTMVAKNDLTRTLEVPSLLVAKWHQVTICVEGRSVDVYLNAKLVTSAIMDNVPATMFSGIMLNSSPDFEGQICLVQFWKERQTAQQIRNNYARHTDLRGRPNVPDPELTLSGAFDKFWKASCEKVGFCGFPVLGPLEYVEYEFA